MNKIPIVFIVFNRPDKAIQSFKAIQRYKPNKLYIVADGPRKDNKQDLSKCEETRNSLLKEIDWECEIYKMFRSENVGCGRSVYSGISWMFKTEKYGAIIEDDCIVSDDFFKFCEELLPLYENEGKIAQINCFLQNGGKTMSSKYYFTGYPSITAWATWKRAWKNIDFQMNNWGKVKKDIFKRFSFKEGCIHYLLWREIHKKIISGQKPNAWGYQWSIYIFMTNKLCIEPEVNLVRNIGFGEGSTNCSDPNSPLKYISYGNMIFPLEHPVSVEINKNIEKEKSKEYVRYYSGLLRRKIISILIKRNRAK